MATAVATIPIGARVPVCILALATKIETQAFVVEATDLVAAFESLRLGIQALLDRYTEIEASVATTQKSVERFLEEVWDDAYTLCGDPECDGTCLVCADGEDETYCRRGKR